MDNKLMRVYDGLPSWGKGIVVIGTLGIVYMIGNKIYKKINQVSEDAKASVAVKGAETELNNLRKNGVNTNFRQTQYTSWANELNVAFQGYGTETGSVMTIFSKLQNEADLYALISAYGIKDVNSGKFNFLNSDFRGDLPSTIKDELNDNDIKALNKILANKKITFQF